MGTVDTILIPETATLEKRKGVMPPRTDAGIDQQAYPALRLAHRVRAITPSFWARVDMGVIVQRPANMPLSTSAKTPPWMRESKSLPSTWRRDMSQVAVMSPIASIMKMRSTVIKGKIIGPYTERAMCEPR
ncbi:hypothetical protein WAI453_009118 [Rhynchosporium graminicola]